jgi:DNA end-binding protein Ku
VPDGKVGHDAFAVIRETIRSLDKVALARVVLINREHVIALEARDKRLMGMLLRISTRCAMPPNISTIFKK